MEDFECLDRFDKKTKIYCVSISAVVVLLTALTVVSFGVVEPTEYGIIYNRISKNIDQKNVYEGGLHFIGPFNKLITYPKIYKTIEFSDNKEANVPALSTRTQEGLELKLHFAFQYQLLKESLPTLYRLMEDQYEAVF